MVSGTEPDTRAELRDALDEIIRRAHANGVDLEEEDVYPLRHDEPAVPDWEVAIVPLSKPGRREE